MSDNRDNIMEEQIRNSVEAIPSSLSPELLEKRLASMTLQEKYARSMSQDIPTEDIKVGGKGKDKAGNKSSAKKIVIPVLVAAGVLLVAGLGLGIGLVRKANVNTEDAVESSQMNNINTTKKVNLFFDKEETDNYEMAYNYLKDFKKYQEEQMYVDYEDYAVEETADAESANESAANPSQGATLTTSGATAKSEGESFTDTNVRTEGVAEADIIKTDGKYIYEYDSYTEHLYFYSVADGKITKEGSVNVLEDDYYFKEMYIYGDKLVLLGTNYDNSYYGSYYGTDNRTFVAIYDISDKGEPELVDTMEQSGSYDDSRMVNGILYTFSRKSFDLDQLKKKKYETYIPDVDGELIENDDLYVQKDIYNGEFEVISSIDVDKASYIDRMAILAGSDTMYVSENNIYLTDYVYDWTSFSYGDDTKIIKISYKDGELGYETKAKLPGYLNDDYSIDEYNGYLRAVTTYRDSNWTQYNALYVFDENLDKVSVIKKMAEGETIRSARFMGETAYFVTFRNTDPLFAVDLSDPENPEITDYLKIPGFSAYLHPYGDGKLLGVGYDTDSTGWSNCIKLTMFDINDPYDIKEENTEILYNYQAASVLNNRNAFMFNKEDGTFGFSVNAEGYYYLEEDWFKEEYEDEYDAIIENYDEDKEGAYYLVMNYDEKKGFQFKMDEKIGDEDDASYGGSVMNDTRGIVIGDYIYIVQSGGGIKSYDTTDYDLVDECD